MRNSSTIITPADYCAIIPTYNNDATLERVVEETLRYLPDVIVVNDGSTDSTAEILKKFEGRVQVITLAKNRGKGEALKTGLRAALRNGKTYAVSLDSDGQHLPSDIPALIEASMSHPGAAIIGARKLSEVEINRKSSFANRFSNFWFTVQTFRRLSDTQTGFRVYPLKSAVKALPPVNRYEAELAMLVLMRWHGVKLVEQPINVYYPPASERVSHFRPGRDFARISVLNTILCVLAVVYGLPLAIGRGVRRGWRYTIEGLPGRLWRTFVASTGFALFSTLIFTPYMFAGGLFCRNKNRRIKFTHNTVYRCARIGAFLLPGPKFVTRNPYNIDFKHLDRGMIAVCNHQSYLDLLALMALSSRMVFLANARISSNRIFSLTFNNGGNCNAAKGFEAVTERCKMLIDRGYTVVVFPEGTRCDEEQPGRWHTGAFELARRLDAPILPIAISGSGKVLGKRDRLLGRGKIKILIGNPETPPPTETPRQTAHRMRLECIKALELIKD